MAFQQGLSGLNVASRALDVTSNNIANAATVGFKAAQAHFADVYAASLTGASGIQSGIGSTVAAIAQQFTQGNVTTTANPLDLAINGQGFYRLDNNGAQSYTRNGQFHVDKDGFIVNDQDFNLTGYPAVDGVIVPSTPEAIRITAGDLAPQATEEVTATLNLDARSDVPTIAPFDPTEPRSYNSSTALTVYDSLGNDHTYTMYFVKTANQGEWEMHTRLSDTLTPPPAGPSATLQFDAFGVLTPAVSVSESFSVPTGTAVVPPAVVAGPVPLAFELTLPSTTQFGNTFSVNQLTQDGFTTGRLAGLNVGQDGIIQGRYTNGQSQSLGQIVLANFTNPNGLTPIGNNQWAETSDSGPPLIGEPDTGRLGVIQSAAVEDSNTDLTAELVNLITQQRNYQANAQSIKTQDQILNTLVNLR